MKLADPIPAPPRRVMSWEPAQASREVLLSREWLVTNGLGGFASGTVSGVRTRRYHGLLVAALPIPFGRMIMWSQLLEELVFGRDEVISLGSDEARSRLNLRGTDHLSEFRLEEGLPVWTFRVRDFQLEKRLFLPHRQNTVLVGYQLSGSGPRPRLRLRPAVHFRHYEAAVAQLPEAHYQIEARDGGYEITSPAPQPPPLRLRLDGGRREFTNDPCRIHRVVFRSERERGYDHEGELWSPGVFQLDLPENETATLIGSTESWEKIDDLIPSIARQAECDRRASLLNQAMPAARDGIAAELVLAADQFVIIPAGRADVEASGDERRTIIAGYHWFTDWGRDTMISLEGLTIPTGRSNEAGCILRLFAKYVRNGLIPNLFPDREKDGLYHTADATLWFFHALGRYLAATGDRATLDSLLPTLCDIAEHHLRGTKFNIHVDPQDGLLVQGEDGYQLTWMDAKMGDWVVTPRRGKAVEINALWYNALELLANWLDETGDEASANRYRDHAERARRSFNERFWYDEGGYLYDVIDTPDGRNDNSIRPNQIFAISLDHPVLQKDRWASVLAVVEKELLTPVGLRSLSPHHPDYKENYHGDLKTRDAAYHQGTVWGWLIGPFIDAWLKLHPDELERARKFLGAFLEHLDEAGLGTISEVFDAEPPHTARGCIAQAWSVAEVLRCWVKTAPR